MIKLIRKLTSNSNWQRISETEYADFTSKVGTSFIGHYDVAKSVSSILGLHLGFKGCFDADDNLVAALPLWDNKCVVGHRRYLNKLGLRKTVDFGCGEFLLPSNATSKLYIPYSIDGLLHYNVPESNNYRLKNKAKSQSALAKSVTNHSKKFRYNQNRSLKQFLEAGGEVFDATKLSNDEFITAYHRLFEKRWGFKPSGLNHNEELLNQLKKYHFGDGLRFNGEIVALQLLYKVQYEHCDYYQYINAGIEPDLKSHSIGSLLCYLNLKNAQESSGEKEFIYSYGYMDADYKSMWCAPHPVYRV